MIHTSMIDNRRNFGRPSFSPVSFFVRDSSVPFRLLLVCWCAEQEGHSLARTFAVIPPNPDQTRVWSIGSWCTVFELGADILEVFHVFQGEFGVELCHKRCAELWWSVLVRKKSRWGVCRRQKVQFSLRVGQIFLRDGAEISWWWNNSCEFAFVLVGQCALCVGFALHVCVRCILRRQKRGTLGSTKKTKKVRKNSKKAIFIPQDVNRKRNKNTQLFVGVVLLWTTLSVDEKVLVLAEEEHCSRKRRISTLGGLVQSPRQRRRSQDRISSSPPCRKVIVI